MPINVLPKETPRGRGPEPTHDPASDQKPGLLDPEEDLKESDLANQEIQALWESQEIGNTSWSGAGGDRYSDPN